MPRKSPTLTEIAASYELWSHYFDVNGLDSPKQWEGMTQRERLDMLEFAFSVEPELIAKYPR